MCFVNIEFNNKQFDITSATAAYNAQFPEEAARKAAEKLKQEEADKNAPVINVIGYMPWDAKVIAEAAAEIKKDLEPEAEQPSVVTAPVSEETTVPPAEPALMANQLSAREGAFFMEKFDTIKRLMPFSEDWMSGNDHFYNLVNGQGYKTLLKAGETARSKDNQGRRLILVGTQFGPVVIYQRYPEGLNTIVYDACDDFRKTGFVKSESRVNMDDLFALLGGHIGAANEHHNIGNLALMAAAAKK